MVTLLIADPPVRVCRRPRVSSGSEKHHENQHAIEHSRCVELGETGEFSYVQLGENALNRSPRRLQTMTLTPGVEPVTSVLCDRCIGEQRKVRQQRENEYKKDRMGGRSVAQTTSHLYSSHMETD